MRTLLIVSSIGLMAALLSSPPAASQDTSGWNDLLGHDLKDWTRMGDGKNPWRLSADRTMICKAATDGYAPDQEFGDGTLKFEYRFHPTGEKTGYKASLTVRRTEAGTGCKIALGDTCGTITGIYQGSSDRQMEAEVKPAAPLGRLPGEWNLVKVRLEGKVVTVTINGRRAGTFGKCDTPRGIMVFESDGSEIEFRQIQWKDEK